MTNTTLHVSAADLATGDILRYRGLACPVTRVHTMSGRTLVGLTMPNGTPEVEIVPATASVHIIHTV